MIFQRVKPIALNLFTILVVLCSLLPSGSVVWGQQADYNCFAQSQIPAIECQALVALYDSTNGPGWRNNTSWLVSLTPGNWHGVTVELGHVTRLELVDNLLSGSLPVEIGNLDELEWLNLRVNQLSGGLIPQLSYLSGLTVLDLSANQFSGGIPAWIGNLFQLTVLDLSGNQLNGSIPPEIGSLANLQHLRLNFNQLSGAIPPEIGSLSNLTWLSLAGNQLSGSIPPQIGSLVNLDTLNLAGNQVSGGLPPEMGSLSRLTGLYLADNQLGGSIPAWIGDLDNLQVLDLSSNQLGGSIPPEIGGLPQLRSLILQVNQLSGGIPAQLGSLASLEQLWLNNNQLGGSIPPEIGNIDSLNLLLLSNNQLSGSIPPQLGSLPAAQAIDLSNNQLGGSIPPALGGLTALQNLSLNNNQLSGSIPRELGNLLALQGLNLGGNQLSGSLPPELGVLVTLTSLVLESNPLSGDIPLSFTNLVNLETFIFSYTALCELDDPAFQAWKAGVERWEDFGVTCARVELYGLEVTQAIQDLNNSVDLVQDKPVYVRAHVHSLSGIIYDQSATLTGTRGGVPLPGSPLRPANLGGTVDVRAYPDRGQLDDSFLFQLPASWRSGTVELAIDLEGDTPFFCKDLVGTAADCKVTATFTPVPALELELVRVKWYDVWTGTWHIPTMQDLNAVIREFRAIYPVPEVQWRYKTDFPGPPPNFMSINIDLNELRAFDGCLYFLGSGCQRIYVGVAVDPQLWDKIYGLGGIPPNVASGFWVPEGGISWVLPHEVGHALGRQHTPSDCGFTLSSPTWNYPYADGHISQEDSGENAFYGFHIYRKKVYGPTTGDLMTYCQHAWPSDWTYEGLAQAIKDRYGAGAPPRAVGIAADEPALLVSGQITPSTGAGAIDSLYHFAAPAPLELPTSGAYALRLETASGVVLASYPFDPVSGLQCPPNCDPDTVQDPFVVALPAHPQAARVALYHGEQLLAARAASPHAPQVSVLYPNGGETLSGVDATLSWSASDDDGDSMEYAVQYSRDGGATWQTLVAGLTSTAYTASLDGLPGSAQGLVRVLASDGFHTAQDDSDAPFSVAGHAPLVALQRPAEGSIYVGSQAVLLEGSAQDLEDGELPGAALQWSSDRDGALGSGASLSLDASALSEGAHVITLGAQDADGQAGAAQVGITVYRERPLFPPALSAAPDALYFSASPGGALTGSQAVSIRNTGDGSFTWTAAADQPWVHLGALSGTDLEDLTIAADPTGLDPGTYRAAVTLAAPGAANSPQTVQVTLTVAARYSAFLPVLMR